MNAKLQTNKIYELLEASDKRISVMQGGSRSGKTYNILILFHLTLLGETQIPFLVYYLILFFITLFTKI